MRTRTTLRIAGAALAIMAPAGVAAQVANPLPQAVGMGGSYTALARGLGAPAWNPAGLGMPDNPGFSITLLPVDVATGLGPITLGDFADYDGRLIPHSTRSRWLDEIARAGGEEGTADADVTYLALSVGRVALSASSSVRSRVDMAPDVAELVLFGNAGLTGEPRDQLLEGSAFDLAATTTFAASFAVPLAVRLGPTPDQRLAIGATLTYTIGNVLVMGREDGGSVGTDPLAVHVRFPLVHTPFPDSAESFHGDDLSNGSGVGLDVGAAWQGGAVSAGVVIRNLISTFEWDTASLEYREGIATWDADTTYSSFEEKPIETAPDALLSRVDDLYTFSPVLAAGAAVDVSTELTVTGEVRHALEDDLTVGAQSHLGVGALLRVVPFLPIRAGVAVISGGYQLSGGLGLRLAGIELSAAAGYRDGELGDDTVIAVGFTAGLP
jgi:hypothetical protein